MEKKITIFASGELGASTLQTLLENNILVEFVFTDTKSKSIKDLCLQHKITYYSGNPNREAGISALKKLNSSLYFSINYIFLLSPDFLTHIKTLILNIHGALLPKYRGRTPHIWAIINGEKETGITIHKIEAGCDTGAILTQHKIPISISDTGGEILEKFKVLYPPLVLEAIRKALSGNFQLQKQDEKNASYFPKRTPEDGAIDWHWSSLRILNWIRALTKPYPGAFTITPDGKKIFIWKAILKTDNHQQNDYLEFKTNDGAILAVEYEITDQG